LTKLIFTILVLEIDNLNFSTQNVENDRFWPKMARKWPFSATKANFLIEFSPDYRLPFLPCPPNPPAGGEGGPSAIIYSSS
jgi:hypothetical protein